MNALLAYTLSGMFLFACLYIASLHRNTLRTGHPERKPTSAEIALSVLFFMALVMAMGRVLLMLKF